MNRDSMGSDGHRDACAETEWLRDLPTSAVEPPPVDALLQRFTEVRKNEQHRIKASRAGMLCLLMLLPALATESLWRGSEASPLFVERLTNWSESMEANLLRFSSMERELRDRDRDSR